MFFVGTDLQSSVIGERRKKKENGNYYIAAATRRIFLADLTGAAGRRGEWILIIIHRESP